MSRVFPSQPPDRSESETEILLADDRVVTLGARIGRGEGGAVYRAKLESPYRVRRPVACKVFDGVPDELRDDVVTAVAKAARAAAAIAHPNVAATYELVVLGDARPVILSELVDGWPLTRLLEEYERRGARIPIDLGLFIAAEIAEGLAGARAGNEGVQRDLVHHDLSARDVLLSRRGEVKITDFGIGRALRTGSSIRAARSLAPRAATMAPEIVTTGRSDARSDVFSLGMLIRMMLVGPRFPEGVSDIEAVKLTREGYVHMGVFERKLPEPLETIVKRAIEIDPKARYPHAGALAYELRRACLSLGVGDGRFFLRNALHEMLVRAHKVMIDDEPTAQHAFTPFVVERPIDDEEPREAPFESDELPRYANDEDGDIVDMAVTQETRVSGIVPSLPDDDEDEEDGFVPRKVPLEDP